MLAGLTLAGFWLRVDGLARQALWSDEDITLDRARLPLLEMLYALPVEHAPLYFISMRPWTLLAGEGDFALRFPSALAGTVAIALAGIVGARLFGRIAGVTAALLVATQLFAVSYGQEARMYALLLAFSLAAPAAILRAERLQRRGAPARRWWIAAGILIALTALTHHYGALIAFVLGAWAAHDVFWAANGASNGVSSGTSSATSGGMSHGTSGGVSGGASGGVSGGAGASRRSGAPSRAAIFRNWSITFATAAVLYLPWLPRALQIGEFPGWRQTTVSAALRSIAGAWLGGTSIASDPVDGAAGAFGTDGVIGAIEPGTPPLDAALIALPLVLAAFGAGWALFTLARRGRGAGSLGGAASLGGTESLDGASLDGTTAWTAAARLVAWLAVPAVVVGTMMWRSPDIHPRYLMPLHAAVWLAAGAGAAAITRRLPRRLHAPAAFAILAALALSASAPLEAYRSGEERQKQGYRELLAEVERHATGRDTVLLLDGPPMGNAQRYSDPDSPVKLENLLSSTYRARSREYLLARLAELAERRPNVWLATDGSTEHLADQWLAENLYPVSSAGYQDITLHRYYAPPAEVGITIEPEWDFDRCVDAAGATIDRDALSADSPGGPTFPHLAIPESAALCIETVDDQLSTVRPGDVLTIWFDWQPGAAWPNSRPATREHRISVRLVDRAGEIMASADRRPVAWTSPTTDWTPGTFVLDRHGLLIPDDTAPGLHRIEIVFYDEQTLAPFATWALHPTVDVVEGDGG